MAGAVLQSEPSSWRRLDQRELDEMPQKSIGRIAAFFGVSVFVAVVLTRLLILRSFGVDTAYWDEWDSIGWHILRPFELNALSWSALFVAHIEHRIVLSRLWLLGIYVLNDRQWDNLVEAACNAVFYSATYALALRRLALELPWKAYSPLLAFGVLAGCLPYAADNVVVGYQVPFYFLVALTVVGIWLASSREPSWRLLVLLLIVCYLAPFSLASGLLTAPAVVAALVIRNWRMASTRRSLLLFAIVLLPATAMGYGLLPAAPNDYVARNVQELIHAAGIELAWPLPVESRWFGWLVWAPYALGCMRVLRDRHADPVAVAATVLGGWVLTQCFGMSYSRGHLEVDSTAFRYADIVAVGLLVNVYFTLKLGAETDLLRRARMPVVVALSVYAGALLYQGGIGFQRLQSMANMSVLQVENMRRYIDSRDIANLQQPGFRIPHPSPKTLGQFLDDPTLRSMLPPSIRPTMRLTPNADFVSNGFRPQLPDPPGRRAIGTYGASSGASDVGRFESAEFTTRFPYLGTYVISDAAQQNIALSLKDTQSSRESFILPRLAARKEWARAIVAAPGPQFSIQAEDNNPNAWFAFTEPVEMGRLTAALSFLFDHMNPLASACFAFWTFALLLCWSRSGAAGRSAEAAEATRLS